MWKLNEAWPLKKNYYSHFPTALKAFKTEIELHHCLTTPKVFNSEKRFHQYRKVFNTEKRLHHLLKTRKVFNIEKELHYFLETLKSFNFEQCLRQILITRKVYQNSYSALSWWTAASQGRLSYHILFMINELHLPRFLGCQTSGTSDKWNCLISWIVG